MGPVTDGRGRPYQRSLEHRRRFRPGGAPQPEGEIPGNFPHPLLPAVDHAGRRDDAHLQVHLRPRRGADQRPAQPVPPGHRHRLAEQRVVHARPDHLAGLGSRRRHDHLSCRPAGHTRGTQGSGGNRRGHDLAGLSAHHHPAHDAGPLLPARDGPDPRPADLRRTAAADLDRHGRDFHGRRAAAQQPADRQPRLYPDLHLLPVRLRHGAALGALPGGDAADPLDLQERIVLGLLRGRPGRGKKNERAAFRDTPPPLGQDRHLHLVGRLRPDLHLPVRLDDRYLAQVPDRAQRVPVPFLPPDRAMGQLRPGPDLDRFRPVPAQLAYGRRHQREPLHLFQRPGRDTASPGCAARAKTSFSCSCSRPSCCLIW